MARLIAPNGATVNVSDEKAARLLGQGYRSPGAKAAKRAAKTDGGTPPEDPETVSPHAGLKVPELKAEIAKRNEGREPEALLSDEGVKAALVAVLDADDAAAAAREDDGADGSGDE